MNVQDLIKYLQTLPCDTKVTCCSDNGSEYYSHCDEVEVENDHLDYTLSTKTLKIGRF
jgi:hypothetical protein